MPVRRVFKINLMERKIHRYLILVALLGLWAPFWTVAQAGGVKFVPGTFEQALNMAQAQGKPLMVHVYASWAEPCKGMDEWIFPDEKVGAFFNERFVSWKYVIDSVEDYSHLGKVRITALPEYLFLNGKGELLYRESGFKDAGEMVIVGQKALNPANHLSAMQKKYDAGERSPSFLIEYITQMDAAGKDMEKVGMQYLQKIPEWELGEEQNWRIQYIVLYEMQSREFRYLLKNRAAFIQQFGDQQVMDVLLRCYKRTMETAVSKRDEALFNTMKPVVDQLSPSAAEAKRTWLMEQMNFYQGIGNWPAYFLAAQTLFAQPGTLDGDFWNDAAWNAAENGTKAEDWEKAMMWVERSIGMGKRPYNLHTKAVLAWKLGKNEQAEEWGKAAMDLARQNGEDYSVFEKFLQKLSNQR